MELNIELPVDNDGFIEYECPHCQKVFRLNKNLFMDSETYIALYCPYCGLSAAIGSFYTTECAVYIKEYAEQLALEELNKSFKAMEKSTRNSIIKFKAGKIQVSEPDKLILHPYVDNICRCNKCNNKYKTEGKIIATYCPYCGEME